MDKFRYPWIVQSSFLNFVSISRAGVISPVSSANNTVQEQCQYWKHENNDIKGLTQV
jgi:hypothetical protein